MRAELIIGLLLVVILAAIGGYFVFQYQTALTVPGTGAVPAVFGQPDAGGMGNILLDTDVVLRHNKTADCWIIVSGKVYSVTNYLSVHPGGAGQISPYCGKDATQAFATRGGTGRHSSTALQQLGALFIGDVGTQTTAQQIQSAEQAPVPSGGENEWEDD